MLYFLLSFLIYVIRRYVKKMRGARAETNKTKCAERKPHSP